MVILVIVVIVMVMIVIRVIVITVIIIGSRHVLQGYGVSLLLAKAIGSGE